MFVLYKIPRDIFKHSLARTVNSESASLVSLTTESHCKAQIVRGLAKISEQTNSMQSSGNVGEETKGKNSREILTLPLFIYCVSNLKTTIQLVLYS